MKITLPDLRYKYNACIEGVKFFNRYYPDEEADYQDMLDLAIKYGHGNWARWLLNKVGNGNYKRIITDEKELGKYVAVAGTLYIGCKLPKEIEIYANAIHFIKDGKEYDTLFEDFGLNFGCNEYTRDTVLDIIKSGYIFNSIEMYKGVVHTLRYRSKDRKMSGIYHPNTDRYESESMQPIPRIGRSKHEYGIVNL